MSRRPDVVICIYVRKAQYANKLAAGVNSLTTGSLIALGRVWSLVLSATHDFAVLKRPEIT